MIKVNILTLGPDSYNARAFLHPITFNLDLISGRKIDLGFHYEVSKSTAECDLLIIDSKFFKTWYLNRSGEMYNLLESFGKSTKVFYFDTTDSSGYLLGDVLPFVEGYFKHQVLRNKEDYLKPMYGRRPFTQFYYEHFGIKDSEKNEEFFIQLEDKSHLDKIKVFWNTGLANYSFSGDMLGKLYKRLPFKIFVRYPRVFNEPEKSRSIDVQCRVNTNYSKETVSYQRKQICNILSSKLQTNKLNRYSFFKEMANSKIVVSPFGLGEITLKDFEVFITGGLLLKPNMNHMETWPDFYKKDKTYIGFNWNLNDLEETIQNILENYTNYISVAKQGQEHYKHYVESEEGRNEFVERFLSIIEA